MDISRRQFIRSAGAAIAVAAAPVILMPEKRIWQVHRDTPLRGVVPLRAIVDPGHGLAPGLLHYDAEAGVHILSPFEEVPKEVMAKTIADFRESMHAILDTQRMLQHELWSGVSAGRRG